MPVPAYPTTLGGVTYVVARDGEGRRRWASQTVPSNQSDLLPFREVVTFSPFGIGSTVPAVDGQCDYFYNCEVDQWDHLGPGFYQYQAGYALDAPVTCIEFARGGVSTYAGNAADSTATTGGGSVAWTNHAQAVGSDNAYATAAVSAVQSQYLHATNVTWTNDIDGSSGLPALMQATTQVTVSVEAKASTTGVVTLQAQLIVGGSRTGTVVSATGALSDSDATFSFAGFATSVTQAQAEASDFGVAVFATSGSASSAVTISIDAVRFTITYQQNNHTTNWYTSQGPVTAGANNADAGTVAWTNPSNCVSSDDTYATAALTPVTSNYLQVLDFDFAGVGTPSGIAVTIEAKVSAGSATLLVSLIIGGTVQSVTKTLVVTETSDTVFSLGGQSDLWSSTLTLDQANAATFGIAILATNASTTALTVSIDNVTATLYTATASPLVYIGAGDTIKKFSLENPAGTPVLTTIETKTFIGSTISDIYSPKDGNTAGQPYVLVAFGNTRQIAQVNTVNPTGADTYGASGSPAAYAGKFAYAMGATNTQVLVWKSLPNGGVSSTSGAFSTVQSAVVSTSNLDMTDSDNWSPATPYAVGNQGTDITDLFQFERGLGVSKPEGVYFFDQNANAFEAFTMDAYRHDENGLNTLPSGASLYIPTIDDLKVFPALGNRANIGLSQLVAHTSQEITGRPVATAAYGDDLYVAFYDGTDSVLCRLRPRLGGEVPHPRIIEPLARFEDYRMNVARVFTDAYGTTMLLFDRPSEVTEKYDIGYITLAPAGRRRYATDGIEWYSTLFGSTDVLSTIERISVFAISCDSSNSWTLSLAADGGSFNAVGAAITSTGRITRSPTAGTNDEGYIWQLKAAGTNAANTNRPRLRGSTSTGEGPSGFIVEGQRQTAVTEVIRATLRVGEGIEDGAGGKLRASAVEAYDALQALAGAGLTPLVDFDHFGSTTARQVYVRVLGYESGPQALGQPSERLVNVELRLPIHVS